MADLDTELATYQRVVQAHAAEEGKFIVISGDDVLGVYAAYEDALQAGYTEYGMKPFLVKRISVTEQIAYFSRDLGTACPA